MCLSLIALGLPWSTHARADVQAGVALAQKGGASFVACATCHGAKGEGQAAAGFPRLAGQTQAYLEKQLQAFASGRRASPLMSPIAKALDAGQIKDVTDFYASLPEWKPVASPDATAPEYIFGEKLATRGKWNEGMPACFACHAKGGHGIPPHFPSIAGQPRAYTSGQLRSWQSNTRSNDPQGLMKSVAVKLTAEEIAAVSLYLENPTQSGKGQ